MANYKNERYNKSEMNKVVIFIFRYNIILQILVS
jgi:hypothetical protein